MKLPAISKALVATVRKDMKTRGYSLVDTSSFVTHKQWTRRRSELETYICFKNCKTDWIKKLIQWQERLLKKALPDEDFFKHGESLSLRAEKYEDDSNCDWHVDGAYIRSICVIEGVSTQIKTPLGASSIPLGWTLFITAEGRRRRLNLRGTWHRRPKSAERRKLIVHGWESFQSLFF